MNDGIDKSRTKWLVSGCLLFIVITIFICISYGKMEPTITYSEFPFSITYRFNDEIITVNDVLVCEYNSIRKDLSETNRYWTGNIGQEEKTDYIIWQKENSCLYLYTGMDPQYYMGDPLYKRTQHHIEVELNDGRKYNEPYGYYWDDDQYEEIYEIDELKEMGFEILSYEYPEPITNSFHYTGIDLNGGLGMTLAIIAALVMIPLLFIIRRDKEYSYQVTDWLSLILNILIVVTTLPIMLILIISLELVGMSEIMIENILTLFAPCITILSVGASVLLRRKKKSKWSLFIQFIGPVMLGISLGIELFADVLPNMMA